MVHVPPLTLYDGKSNYSAIQCDLVIKGTYYEMDYICPKDRVRDDAPHMLFGMYGGD